MLFSFSGRPVRDPTDPDFVPSLFSFTPATKKSERVIKDKVDRHERLQERTHQKNRKVAAAALLHLFNKDENTVPGVGTQTNFSTKTESKGTQTDLTYPLIKGILKTNTLLKNQQDTLKHEIMENGQVLESQRDQISALELELENLKAKLTDLEKLKEENELQIEMLQTKTISFASLSESNKKIKFYTGLPNTSTFMAVFETTKVHANRKNTKLDHKDELLLTLLKLRRNLAMEDIAYRFNTSTSQVTKIFHRWLTALHVAVGGLVLWPKTDVMELPDCFQNDRFRKVRCVIDCTEIFIDRPSALKARAQTYSSYKRHNTVKVLVGVSPTGAVIFLSECWGGRVSDKQITINSGFLDKLLPGDVILADRGFTMDEEFQFRGAKLMVPAFTKGKGQLSSKEVEDSRLLSRARIHVERVIGRLKDFEIIKGNLPLTLIKSHDEGAQTTIDKIIRVIGAVINMNDRLL